MYMYSLSIKSFFILGRGYFYAVVLDPIPMLIPSPSCHKDIFADQAALHMQSSLA